MKKGKLLKCCFWEFSKFKRMNASLLTFPFWDHFHISVSRPQIPKDVPRGHLAVYVGEDCRRFVINVTLLNHPLFKALLDNAEEVFGFPNGNKLHIPCSESNFLRILHSVNSAQDQRLLPCF